MQLAIRDINQGPFLTQVLRFGRESEHLSDQQLDQIKGKAVLMSLKFADKYYNKYKMHLLEQAAHDVIGVVSLGLLELSQRDTAKALALLQAPEGPIKPFQKGWSMLISVSAKQPGGNSLYGDVDARLLDKISSPPDVEEWQGWQEYEKALVEHNKTRLMSLIDQHFFACENDHPTMEDKLAEALLYRILCGNGSGAPLKVKQDLKRRLARDIVLQEAWYDTDYLAAQLELLLAELPSELIAGLRQELSKGFVANLLHTLGFVRQYQLLQQENASPEKLDNVEMRAGLKHPLLGWPLYHDF